MNNLQTAESLVDEDRQQISLYKNLTIFMFRYVLMIPVFGGFVATVLCLLTLQMSSFRECAAGFLLSALTVVDMASLAMGGIHAWVFGTFHFDLCQLYINITRAHNVFDPPDCSSVCLDSGSDHVGACGGGDQTSTGDMTLNKKTHGCNLEHDHYSCITH